MLFKRRSNTGEKKLPHPASPYKGEERKTDKTFERYSKGENRALIAFGDEYKKTTGGLKSTLQNLYTIKVYSCLRAVMGFIIAAR